MTLEQDKRKDEIENNDRESEDMLVEDLRNFDNVHGQQATNRLNQLIILQNKRIEKGITPKKPINAGITRSRIWRGQVWKNWIKSQGLSKSNLNIVTDGTDHTRPGYKGVNKK